MIGITIDEKRVNKAKTDIERSRKELELMQRSQAQAPVSNLVPGEGKQFI